MIKVEDGLKLLNHRNTQINNQSVRISAPSLSLIDYINKTNQ